MPRQPAWRAQALRGWRGRSPRQPGAPPRRQRSAGIPCGLPHFYSRSSCSPVCAVPRHDFISALKRRAALSEGL